MTSETQIFLVTSRPKPSGGFTAFFVPFYTFSVNGRREKREMQKGSLCVCLCFVFTMEGTFSFTCFFCFVLFFFIFYFEPTYISKCCRTHTKNSSYDIIFHWIFFHKQLPRLKHSNCYFLRACVPWVVISHPVGKTEKFCNFSFL